MSDNITDITKKKINQHFPNQDFGFIEDEYWKPAIMHGKTIDGYTVSNYGNVIGPKGYKLKWTGRSKTQPYPSVHMYFDPDFFEHHYPLNTAGNADAQINVHILVANVFLPLDENIPEELDKYIEIDGRSVHLWSLFTEEQKLWIRSLLQVDHIDNDKSNPHVDNLQFTNFYANNIHIKKALNESSNK